MMRNGHAFTLTMVALVFALTANVQAAVYKWADKNGITHYSQQRPKGIDPSKIEIVKPSTGTSTNPKTAMTELKSKLEAFSKRQNDQQEANAKATEESGKLAAKEASCTRKKGQLSSLQNRPRQVTRDAEGNIKVMPEEERQSRIGDLESTIKESCS